MKKQKGFTFIETLIVIAVIALIITLTIVSYRYFEKRTELETTAQKITAVLKSAQNKTLASEDDSQYGVHFKSNQYILFKGDIYQEGAADNKTYQITNQIEISQINLAQATNTVVFQRINGQTNDYGTIILTSLSQPGETKTINIQLSGQIELISTTTECCNTNRLIDSRHIHFNLGWSIQNSNTLTLYFTDTPEVVFNINMADYFNLNKTEFNWSDTVEVNGENQTLEIHTHALDSVNTSLCIHRKGEENNKSLQILIDDKEIVSYTADGQPTIGFWGGIMEVQ